MIREYSYRVEVLRNGAVLTELLSSQPPAVNFDAQAGIKSSMAGTFLHNDKVNYLTDELRLVQCINGVEEPLGIFAVGTCTDVYDDAGIHRVQLEAYDRGYRLTETRSESILHLDAGTNYLDAVEQLLTEAGIYQVMATPTPLKLAMDREDWDMGTEYLEIVNTLLEEINYNPVWFNSAGYAVLAPCKDPGSGPVSHIYDGTNEISILRPGIQVERDAFGRPNVFIVICENPDLPAPLTATAVNDDPISSLSTVKRGRRICAVERIDNVASQAELDKYAKRLMTDSMLSSEVLTVQTAIDGGHGLLDTVAINHPQVSGSFEELSWRMTLAPGEPMTHRLRRLIIL